MATPNFRKTKLACFSAYFTMASTFSLPPLLFITFHDMYGISYSLLGTLVLTNFCTQLLVDIIFTLFSKSFKVHRIMIIMPALTSVGFFVYAIIPILLPNLSYSGILTGTIIFSIGAGLSEVLVNPIVAALPSDNPQRDMSMLHSLYAFGVVAVVASSTAFFKIFGSDNWMYLTLFFAILPILSSILFIRSPIPDMCHSEYTVCEEEIKRRTVGLALCVVCIFFGGASEQGMSNWISGYMENALHIDKTLGNTLGMGGFAILLGIARISYAKYGKHIYPVLLYGMTGASVCYLIVAFSSNVILSFVACVLIGLFTSMLWTGSLIMMEEKVPNAGVAAYALMAVGGDLGASVSPQLMGIVIDQVSLSRFAVNLSTTLNLTTEQIGMKAGMLFGAIFPLLGTVTLIITFRYFKKENIKS